MPEHRARGRGRNRRYQSRHSAGAALELQGTTESWLAGEPELELEPAGIVPLGELVLEPVPDHVQGQPLGDTERVSMELHMAAAAAGDTDRSDGIWRV